MNENGLTEAEGMWEPAGTAEKVRKQAEINTEEIAGAHEYLLAMERSVASNRALTDRWTKAIWA